MRSWRNGMWACVCAALVVGFVSPSMAGTFATITIDDDYSDWATIPLVCSDPADNVGAVDIADVQLANDDDYLYLRITYHEAAAFSTFISVDTDESTATGFDIFSMGLVGSEASWQNDFPFDQRTGWNVGGIDQAATLSPWADTGQRELAIPRSSAFTSDGAPVFPDNEFNLLVWTDAGSADVSAAIPYTFAVPEPTSAMLLVIAATLVGRKRR